MIQEEEKMNAKQLTAAETIVMKGVSGTQTMRCHWQKS